MENKIEIYAIVWNGDEWQSVFPSDLSSYSQLHVNVQDAYDYMVNEVGVVENILIIQG